MVSPKGNHVFIWKDFSEWKPALESMYLAILTPELEDKVRRRTPPVKYRNDSELFKELSSRELDEIVTSDKIDEFRGRYSHIQVFHGCRPRPSDIKSYYKRGLLPSRDCKRAQIQRFKQIFLTSSRFPELTEEMLQESIGETQTPDEDLCLVIDSQNLVERDGQYLIYHGGEYLLALVSGLPIGNKDRYRAELRKIGTPTLFEINLPSEHASDSNLWELICDMLMNWVYYAVYPRRVNAPFDLTFSIEKPLPGEHIRRIHHPPRIKDPRMGGKVYVTATGEYEDPN